MIKKILSILIIFSFVATNITPVMARTPQVQIESRIAEVSTSDLEELPSRNLSDISSLVPPPNQTSFGRYRGIGENFGFSGIIIICFKINKKCAYGIFDNRGTYIGSVTKEQAKDNPGRTAGLLAVAEARSQAHFGSALFGNPGSEFGTLAPRIGFTYDITGDGETVLKSRPQYTSQTPQGESIGGTASEDPFALSDNFRFNSGLSHGLFRDPIYNGDTTTNGLSLGGLFDKYQSGFTPPTITKEKKKDKDAPEVAQQPDSVNWENINLNYKAPRNPGETGQLTINDLALKQKIMGGGMTEIPPPTLDLDAGDDTPVDSVVDDLQPYNLGGVDQTPSKTLDQVNTEITQLEKKIKDTQSTLEKMPKVNDDALNVAAQDSLNATIAADQVKLKDLKAERKTIKSSSPVDTAGQGSVLSDDFGALPRTGLLRDPAMDWQPPADDLFSGGTFGGPIIKDKLWFFNPRAGLAAQLGQSPGEINEMAGLLNDSLTCRRPVCSSIECFVIFIGRPRIYIIETIWGRVILKKKPLETPTDTNPNDPFYHHAKKKKKKKKGLLGAISTVASVGGILSSDAEMISGGAFGVEFGESKEDIKDQWGLKVVGYTPMTDPNSAWNVVDGSEKNVVVAVIDSGLDRAHVDSPQYVWENEGEIPGNGKDDDFNGYIDDVSGWNFIENSNDLTDKNGHGTFVSGIIAAKRNNGKGIAGINPGAIIMPLKVINKEGETNSFSIFRAIHYAVDNGARIINISLGGRGVSQLEQLAINYAHARGVFVAIASGNTGEYMPEIGPASARKGMAVGAIDHTMLVSIISSYGPNNAIMAPGEMIYSLRSVDSFHKRAFSVKSIERYYFAQSGTSFSTPMVSATASLMLVKNPKMTNAEMETILRGTATDMDKAGWDDMSGAGLLNAARALRAEDQSFLTMFISDVKVNKNARGKFESVDFFGTVKGEFESFTVEVAKGKHSKKFKQVSGPYNEQADYAWIARIPKKKMQGNDEWQIRLNVKDRSGKSRYAAMLLKIK